MRWVRESEIFQRVLNNAQECASYYKNQQLPAKMVHFTFEYAEFHTRRFLDFLHKLMEWSGEPSSYYIVLNPDPINYFFHHFSKYPLLEITIDDSEETYLRTLDEDPGDSPADAVGVNCFEFVILSPSKVWFMYLEIDDRSDEGGQLYVPASWSNKVQENYPSGSLH